MAATLEIRLARSTIGCKPSHRRTVQALGLRRLNAVVRREATPTVLGMIRTVQYLLDVREADGTQPSAGAH